MEHACIVEDKFNQLTVKFCELEESKEKTDYENEHFKKKEK
jgi:hypothetical protein